MVTIVNDAAAKAITNNAPLLRATSAFRSAYMANGYNATIASTTASCANSGTMTFSGSTNTAVSPATFNLTVVFANCMEDNQRLNGGIYITGTLSGTGTSTTQTFTMAMGSAVSGSTVTGNFVSDFFASNYTVLTGKLSSNLSITGTGTYTTTNQAVTFTGTGSMSFTDYLNGAGQTYTITLTNLSENASINISGGTTSSSTVTVNGGFSESWTPIGTTTPYTLGLTFTTFVLVETNTSTYHEYTANGTVVVATSPATYCNGTNGTFVIATTTPVRYTIASGYTTAGRMTINTSQVVIVWNSDGSVTVTSGGASSNYANVSIFESGCAFADMSTQTGQTSATSTGTLSSGWTAFSASGSTMVSTVTWKTSSGTTTHSDMDMHLRHYASTTPTSTSTSDWNVYYGNTSATLSNPSGTAALDYDMCPGGCSTGVATAGPEHITLTSLPSGYYVLSVNSYTLASDPGAVLTVTLQIGNNSYTFPTRTLTVADYNGTDYANAWYRVADVVVSGSTITVKPANTAIMPAPAVGNRAPKMAR